MNLISSNSTGPHVLEACMRKRRIRLASSPDWAPVPLGDDVFGLLDVRPSMVFTGGRIEVFDEVLFDSVARFTSIGGRTFTRSTVPDSSNSLAVHATLDPSDNIVLVEERSGPGVVLQRSDTNWSPEIIADGRFPSVAVGADAVVHILKRENFRERCRTRTPVEGSRHGRRCRFHRS